jgi:hypothetical protein
MEGKKQAKCRKKREKGKKLERRGFLFVEERLNEHNNVAFHR